MTAENNHDYPDPSDPYVLPTDSDERKTIPIFSGVLNYFPLAIAAVARVSKRGNDKHNPGEPMHWARGKSMDHTDCIARHLLDVETIDPKSGEYEDAQALAWRALAKLQELEEKRLGKPASRGSKAGPLAELVHRATVPHVRTDWSEPVAAPKPATMRPVAPAFPAKLDPPDYDPAHPSRGC